MGKLWCGEIAVWGSCGVGKLRCGGVSLWGRRIMRGLQWLPTLNSLRFRRFSHFSRNPQIMIISKIHHGYSPSKRNFSRKFFYTLATVDPQLTPTFPSLPKQKLDTQLLYPTQKSKKLSRSFFFLIIITSSCVYHICMKGHLCCIGKTAVLHR